MWRRDIVNPVMHRVGEGHIREYHSIGEGHIGYKKKVVSL